MITVLFFIFLNVYLCYGEVSDYNYNRMPPVFHLDDLDTCMVYGVDALYCTVTIELGPTNNDNGSEVWNIIQEVNRLPRSFNHSRLRHAICVPETCPNIKRINYGIGNGTLALQIGINGCYSDKYKPLGLKANLLEINCQNNDPIYYMDYQDYLFLYCLFGLFFIIFLSTIYMKYSSSNTKMSSFLSCFALQTNWKLLLSDKTSGSPLSCIEGIRVMNMLLVILAHTLMSASSTPMKHTRRMEDAIVSPLGAYFSNGALAVQTNYIIAGFLLAFGMFKAYEAKTAVQLKDFVKLFLKRYIRLTPIMLSCIWFHSTILRHLGNGANWTRLVDREYKRCRSNWWTNALYINNYYTTDMCLAHTWYIASDTQLFLVSLIVLYFGLKYKQHAGKIISGSILIGVIIPFLDSYFNGYDIIVKTYPEAAYELMLNSREWQKSAIPGHSNMGCYMQGLAFGYIFFKYRTTPIKLNKFCYVLWCANFWIVPNVIVFFAYFIYTGYPYTQLESALYNSLARNIFGCVMGLTILGMAFGNGGIIKRFCECRPFRILGKLSYCVYIFHGTHMRIRIGSAKQVLNKSPIETITDIFGDFLLSYVIAAIAFMFIELPITGLQRYFLEGQHSSTIKENYSKSNGVDSKKSK